MFRIVFAFTLVILASMTMQAHVDLKYPEGGETHYPGETVNIVWDATMGHSTLNWDLFYSIDGGLNWTIMKEDLAAEARNYQWIVPDVPSMKVRIKVIQDNEGGDYENSSQDFTIASATGIQRPVKHSKIRVFPNPITDIATIEFDKPDNDKHSLIIYNIQGGVVRSITQIGSGKIDMQRGSLPAGHYFIQLRDEQEVRGTGKLVIH